MANRRFDGASPKGSNSTHPMFDQTIERCLRDPFRLLFWRRTDMDVLAEFVAASPGLEPSGFIFHLSRCGSTLVAQMLAASSEALVMSEPPAFDQVLRAPTFCPDLSPRDHVAWLRWMLSALGQRRKPDQSRFVVKLDAWAIVHWRLIRQAFPDTPCIFLYRDPLEVMVSHLADVVSHDPRHTLERRCRTRSRRRAVTPCRGVLRLCPESALRGRSRCCPSRCGATRQLRLPSPFGSRPCRSPLRLRCH